ncbi:hypothetical protein NQ314_014195 [Rhamnusium bicolor]|uniref:Uncharacterized protein n=1 Tax=Rhamnusium bicolor TaxID=1586634 RepID=A0AAV8X271_9CUCU|nr:hypothetical protein NQ314_014195 [Rhamnusium bicolor]
MDDFDREQERLKTLFEEVSTALEEESESDKDEVEVDFVEERSVDSNSEQDLDEVEGDDFIDNNDPIFIGKDGVIKWKEHSAPNKNIKTRSENIIKKIIPGVPRSLRYLKTPLDIWKTFFSDEILNTIVICTNQKIEVVSEKIRS